MAVEREGFPPLAIFRVANDYYVTDNRCTHGNGLLTEGFQDGGNVECPFHGGAFDIATGKAVAAPCRVALTVYDVKIEAGWITIPEATLPLERRASG